MTRGQEREDIEDRKEQEKTEDRGQEDRTERTGGQVSKHVTVPCLHWTRRSALTCERSRMDADFPGWMESLPSSGFSCPPLPGKNRNENV